MFIERHLERFLLAPSGAKRKPRLRTIAENIALRWSAVLLTTGFYKHLAPLEPEPYLIAASRAVISHESLIQLAGRDALRSQNHSAPNDTAMAPSSPPSSGLLRRSESMD
jgi:hypothetical protein